MISQPSIDVHKSGTFLSLPAEIRNEIYTLFLTEDGVDAKALNHGANHKLNLLLTCKRIYLETRPIVFATQPAFLDLWSGSGSLSILLHAQCGSLETKGCMLGSARIPTKLSHHMPIESIKRLVIRHFNWKKGSAANFLPIDQQTFQRLKPDEIHLQGYYCGKKIYIASDADSDNPYSKFMAAILFLTKTFGSTDRFIASLCMDECWTGYGFETWVSFAHYCVQIISAGLGHGWKFAKRENLGQKGVKLIYTLTSGDGDDEVLVRTVTFELRLLVLVGVDECLESII
jgi:hypothetical protein